MASPRDQRPGARRLAVQEVVTPPLWRTSGSAGRRLACRAVARCGPPWYPRRLSLAPAAERRRACACLPGRHGARATRRRRHHVGPDGPRRLRVRVNVNGTAVDLVTCHLKSKLLSYPAERLNPRDEGERARYAGYALALRAAEAVTLRDYATALLDGQGQQRAVIVLGDLNDEPLAATTPTSARPARLGDQHTRLRPRRSRRRATAVEPRPPHPARGSSLQPRVQWPPGAESTTSSSPTRSSTMSTR